MKYPHPFASRFSSLLGFSLAVAMAGMAPAGLGQAPAVPAAPPATAAAITPTVAGTPPSVGNPTIAAAPAVVRPNAAIIPVPQRAEDRLPPVAVDNFNTRHERYVGLAKQGGIDLLFLGDSITQNWGGVGQEAWKQYYSEMKAAAFGIGYDRTQHLLWRLQNGEGEGLNPKAVVIMIGTNNIGLQTPAEIAAGISFIVHEVRTRFATAKVLLLGIFPRDLKGSNNRRLGAETNQLIAALNDGQHIFYLDLADKFMDAEGNIPAELISGRNPLHPTAKGHAVWAEALKEPLAKLMQ